MLQTILVPLDGSALAERALPFAVRISRAAGATLVLVRAGSETRLAQLDEGLIACLDASRHADAELADVARRLQAAGTPVETRVRCEDAVHTILEIARERQADLIVMSTHGRGGLGRWAYGAVADQLLRQARVPVLLVPATPQYTWPDDRPLRVLVPLDGSAVAETTVGPAVELARALGADITLVRVVDDGPAQRGEARDASALDLELGNARVYLTAIAACLAALGTRVAVNALVGDPAAAIARLRREQHADLIALTARGAGEAPESRFGGIATWTLQRATAPVLVLGPAALELPDADSPSGGRAEPERSVQLGLSLEGLALVQRGLADLLRRAEGEPAPSGRAAAVLSGRLRKPRTDAALADAVSRLLVKVNQAAPHPTARVA
jgi:nucleotide-binding universal stress UspA family protein